MKTKTNTLLGAVLFLLVIGAGAPLAEAQDGLVAWGRDFEVSGTPAGTFVAVDAGVATSVALRSDGTIVSWGSDIFGLVSGTPAGTFSAVAAGNNHCVAIRADGTLVSWGNSDFGLISGTPAGTFSAVSGGGDHKVAIRTNGSLAAWGRNSSGQTIVPAGTFTAVAAGARHNVAIRTDRTLVSWGSNSQGQVSGTPIGTFVAVAAGDSFSVAIRDDGTLVAWGQNDLGQVSALPTGTFIAVAAGLSHGAAIRTDGSVVCWGSNDFGQTSGAPAGMFSAVACSWRHTVAIGALADNQLPLATDDFFGIDQGGSLSVASPGVLANDSDPDEDPLTVEFVSGPANAASFQLNPDGSFSYTPVPFFYGEDSFAYRVNDGTVDSETATVHITVTQPGSQGFITGGGKIFQDGRKCTFGFVAKVQGNGVQGNLEFQDHDMSLDVKAATMVWVYAPNQIDGSFSGTCRVNGVSGYTFFVQVHDRGQPGSNDDMTIWVFDSSNNPVYSAGALLSGGNIVIHGH